MLDTVRLAAVAIDSQPGAIAENLAKIDHWAARAAQQGAQLALFPELSLSGFIPNHPQGDHAGWLRAALAAARQAAIELESPYLSQLSAIAAQHKLLLCAGMLEDAGNLLYNAQVLVGPAGLLGVWRKLHVPMFEMPFYNPGTPPAVVDTPLGRLGVNICFDVLLPESTRLLAVRNVEIVLMPFAADPPPPTPAGWAAWGGGAIRARAVENGVFAVACNYVGHVECAGVTQDFPGGGMVVSPRGERLAEWTAPAGQCGLLVAELRAADLQAARAEPEYLFRFRRPELYRPLAEPPT